MERQVSCLWKEPRAAASYKTAVSLHSHTNHSQESLGFIGDFLERTPVLREWIRGEDRKAVRRSANGIAFAKAYWTPPLAPGAAYRLESSQIELTLGLRSLVSISDHDTIGAPMALRVMPETSHVPVSVEWTVPYGEAVFHMGIHNLPPAEAEAAMERMKDYTANPGPKVLGEMLAWFDSHRDMLVILNHPFWDLAHIGKERHENALHSLLAAHGQRIHALELSGIRSWEENQNVRRLAEGFNQMVVSGGDRHGTEPNATLNLTNAATFEAFVHEIRRERRGHVLFMPQYRECNTLRILQTLLSVVREYPEFPVGSQRWDERVFHPDRQGEIRQLAELWAAPPAFLRGFFATLHLLEVSPLQKALRRALRQPAERFSAPLPHTKEIAP